ncbi:Ribonuclease H domain [Macleaya cordata]|uniref:Ribonuclease H domain n=1 Tax=Macleaya cordata TaxID=56857 RepID=A0A200Q9K4_MACCD|nr:Ribonuclease H domain [Macleaya cordata]
MELLLGNLHLKFQDVDSVLRVPRMNFISFGNALFQDLYGLGSLTFSDSTQETSILLKSCMHNKIEDLIIFSSLKMSSRPVHHRRIFECYWIPPHENQIKICCDGCSKGNPGFSGAGIVIRNHRGNTLAAMSIGLGICTNFVAEILPIILAMEWAFDQGWSNILCQREGLPSIGMS